MSTRASDTIGAMGVVPHRFTREEYDRMVESGALEDVKVELLDGEIVDVSPQGPEHIGTIRALTVWFASRAEHLLIQGPLAATQDSEPEPDIAIVEPFAGEHPQTALLAVEVVVSQRPMALRKASIYARAGVGEYWIVDMPRREVIVHTEPTPDGYAKVEPRTGDALLTPPLGLQARPVSALFAGAPDA